LKKREFARDIEKEKLLKRLAEIDKEEEVEKEEQEFLFDDEVDMNMKIKCKRDTGGMVFHEMVEVINLTEDDKKFLELKQQQYVKEFLEKFMDNDFLYIYKNIYELQREYNSFILLNIPEDEESFKKFIREKYKAVDVNLSGVSNHTNYKIYFTNTLQA
jgi:hypothetical protein